MKAKINVKFEKIAGQKVTKKLLSVTPQLKKSTEKTIEILCKQIQKYFEDNKIKTKVDFMLE